MMILCDVSLFFGIWKMEKYGMGLDLVCWFVVRIVWRRKAELQVRAAYGLEVDAAAQAGPVLYSVRLPWMIHEHHGTARWVAGFTSDITPQTDPECKLRRLETAPGERFGSSSPGRI